MTTAAAETGSTAVILDWLASQPTGGLSDEIGEFAHHLGLLAAPGIAAAQQHRCIELFYSRGLRIASDLKPRLIEAGLPLDRSQHTLARQLIGALVSTAEGFLQTIRQVQNGTIRHQLRLIETLAARGLRLLSEAHEISGLAGGAPTPSLWPTAFALFEASATDATPGEPESGESALFAFKRLAAIACIQLQRLSQTEIAWTSEYLNRIASLVQIDDQPPINTDAACFWIASGSEEGPQSFLRKTPSGANRALYVSMTVLARRVAEHLARLEAGQQPLELNLPRIAVGVQPMALLQRLRHELAVPAKREQPRRKSQYSVQACTGIPAIWESLRSNTSEVDGKIVQEWQVTNESPGGFSIIHVAGSVEGLNAGMAVSLRNDAEAPWTICVVRWIRSETPDQVELGLQVVSTGATPVMVGFRGPRERPNRMVKALVLPALPALRHHPAVMAPTGTYSSRRFSLVSDLDRVYIAQGRLLSLDMQTANIELFQFEIDPYPI
jgi:hypothetical protein